MAALGLADSAPFFGGMGLGAFQGRWGPESEGSSDVDTFGGAGIATE